MRNADEKMQILLVHAQTEAPKSECCWSPNQDHCEKFLLNLISFRRPSLPSASFEGEGHAQMMSAERGVIQVLTIGRKVASF